MQPGGPHAELAHAGREIHLLAPIRQSLYFPLQIRPSFAAAFLPVLLLRHLQALVVGGLSRSGAGKSHFDVVIRILAFRGTQVPHEELRIGEIARMHTHGLSVLFHRTGMERYCAVHVEGHAVRSGGTDALLSHVEKRHQSQEVVPRRRMSDSHGVLLHNPIGPAQLVGLEAIIAAELVERFRIADI